MTELSSINGKFPKRITKIDGVYYILKYPYITDENIILPLHLTEFISCRILEFLKEPVQETKLGYYLNDEVVFVKKFDKNIIPIYTMGSYTLNTDNIPNKSLNNNKIELLEKIIKNENKFEKIFTIILLDKLILNTDRHLGNIAIYENGKLSPSYDNGLTLGVDRYFIDKNKESEYIISKYKMQFRYKGKRMNFKTFLNKYDYIIENLNINYLNNLKYKIEELEIYKIIDEIPLEMREKYKEYINFIENLIRINKIIVINGIDNIKKLKIGGDLSWT